MTPPGAILYTIISCYIYSSLSGKIYSILIHMICLFDNASRIVWVDPVQIIMLAYDWALLSAVAKCEPRPRDQSEDL